MFKIISLSDNKGSVYSPFIIAALILITFSVSAHFIEAEAERVSSIVAAGRIRAASLDMEEIRAEACTMAFLSLRAAYSRGSNRTAAEIEDEVAADMGARVRGMGGLSSIVGNYSFSLKNLSGGKLLLESVAAPKACVNRSAVVVCSDLLIEKVIDKRWIP